LTVTYSVQTMRKSQGWTRQKARGKDQTKMCLDRDVLADVPRGTWRHVKMCLQSYVAAFNR